METASFSEKGKYFYSIKSTFVPLKEYKSTELSLKPPKGLFF